MFTLNHQQLASVSGAQAKYSFADINICTTLAFGLYMGVSGGISQWQPMEGFQDFSSNLLNLASSTVGSVAFFGMIAALIGSYHESEMSKYTDPNHVFVRVYS